MVKGAIDVPLLFCVVTARGQEPPELSVWRGLDPERCHEMALEPTGGPSQNQGLLFPKAQGAEQALAPQPRGGQDDWLDQDGGRCV